MTEFAPMTEFNRREVGFTSPATEKTFFVHRSIELAATVGLAVALVIAAAAVSIGMARAEKLGGAAPHHGFPLAIAAAGLGIVVTAGWSGMTALVTRDTKLRRG
jgi:hypothetical protein